MDSDITKIFYCISQGEATQNDWDAYAIYAEQRLRAEYPDAVITVDQADDDPDAHLCIETREDHDDDDIGHLYRVRSDAATFVGRLWDE